MGLQNFGISFDDSTFYQHYVNNQPGLNGSQEFIAVYGGPLAGGTTSMINIARSLTPDVWFGATRGTADNSSFELSFTSPPSPVAGPVNVKFIYPDGTQLFYPQLFGYGTTPQYAVTSGSSPDGGGPAQILGYGLPDDPSSGTLSVGGNTATITTTKGQYPALSGEPYPSTILKYIFPAGTPGWADLQVTTPNGSGTLPKSIFYAKSVTDYSTSDTLSAVLVDEKRHQVYVSAGDHIDVFSTTSNQFVAPLQLPANGTQKKFAGLALTPDGNTLLAADLADGSIAVISPDSPSSAYAVAVAPAGPNGNGCGVGPLYVAATSAKQAFVTTGSLPAPSCPPSDRVYVANLQTHSVTQATNTSCLSGVGVQASSDGNFVAIGAGPCIYSVQTGSYSVAKFPVYYGNFGVAISGDGNVVGQASVLGDVSGNMVGLLAHPVAFYGAGLAQVAPTGLLLNAQINAAGSSYFLPYQNYFEIYDVARGSLRMRFSLTQTIVNTAATPLGIDSGGRHVYLLTDKGLTVVDFGQALLSIGHLSQRNVSAGAQITVRGSGFDSSTAATVGGEAASVSVTDENTLTLTIPAGQPGSQDLTLTRADGQSYTLQNAVVLP